MEVGFWKIKATMWPRRRWIRTAPTREAEAELRSKRVEGSGYGEGGGSGQGGGHGGYAP